jgi:hypothetical protein
MTQTRHLMEAVHQSEPRKAVELMPLILRSTQVRAR